MGDNSIIKNVEEIKQIFSERSSWPIQQLSSLSDQFVKKFRGRGRVAFVGNGGSAAEAMHLAAEFTGKCVRHHEPWPAICLNESQSSLTAIVNDYGSDFMFSRQVEAHLKQHDILIALSTSGTSSNILNALHAAIDIGVECYLWTGRSAPDIAGVQVFRVPSNLTPRIQEIHLAWGHLLAERVEELMSQDSNP